MQDSKDEKVGIESLEALAVSLAKAGEEIAAIAEDEKVTVWETIGLSDNIIEVFNRSKDLESLKKELLDFSTLEKKYLTSQFITEFNIEQDNAEEKVEAIFGFILSAVDFVNVMRK